MVLYDLYESHYKIYNHFDKSVKRPLAGVALHESEDNAIGTQLYAVIEMFVNKDIATLFNISLIEFLALPSEYCLKLVEIANKIQATKSNALDSIAAGFDANKRPT